MRKVDVSAETRLRVAGDNRRSNHDAGQGQLQAPSCHRLHELDLHGMQAQPQIVRPHSVPEAYVTDRRDLARSRCRVGERHIPVDAQGMLPPTHRGSATQGSPTRRLEAGNQLLGQSRLYVCEAEVRVVERERVGQR